MRILGGLAVLFLLSFSACSGDDDAADDSGEVSDLSDSDSDSDDKPPDEEPLNCEIDGAHSCTCGTPAVFADEVASCDLESVATAGEDSQCCDSSIDCACKAYGCYLTGSVYCACGKTDIVGTGGEVRVDVCSGSLLAHAETHCCQDDILGWCSCGSQECSGGDLEVISCTAFDTMGCESWQEPVASCK